MVRSFQNPPLFYIAAVVLALLIAAAWFVVEKTNLERHQTELRNKVLLELTKERGPFKVTKTSSSPWFQDWGVGHLIQCSPFEKRAARKDQRKTIMVYK